MDILKLAAVAAFGLVGTAAMAAPAVMVQAKEGVILEGGPGFGTLLETYNQLGLSLGYVDEVTDFHSYIATPPTHTLVFNGFEWFSNDPTTSAKVSYYVNTVTPLVGIDHFVLWNEETSGIGTFNLWYGASPGDLADLVLAGVSPFDNPLADYAPEYWEFRARPEEGWWTLEMTGCPQPDPGSFASCAIGEVAFGGFVPEPATWALMVSGFGLVGWAMRRKGVALISA